MHRMHALLPKPRRPFQWRYNVG